MTPVVMLHGNIISDGMNNVGGLRTRVICGESLCRMASRFKKSHSIGDWFDGYDSLVWIDEIEILPQYRRHGYATAAMELLFKRYHPFAFGLIAIPIDDISEETLVKFYKRFGFQTFKGVGTLCLRKGNI